ncbi:uncharacterized protein LACBIDRAFT_238810 [Laccaria bicolor S238N-H82]|uniref:Predicted protein n=1 Tax=Laccaria bicolor (strain S238N-H82 / ATCC MYA-4686) TaxID=486041 RepID=B0DQI3_LACBS|nr:uncharacterized protein LACBIDRAFT_238810 [Laccaria bicolor S238N-H82]EDR03117.1 predicted protein [Laccaria bicolor S238N-H82]|eukprot:XP_001886258.1 predicted protein [Laccaria bicolor S238N-H82]
METNLPSWTITKYEVDRENKIGVGFFSDVYKGTWRGRTVAVKVLAETTPRKLFVREVEIWKNLRHPNVLQLCGASSASGKAPWFFVSPYMKNGSLVEFLKRIGDASREWDLFRFMYEIAKGMEYLHTQDVLHGDLKAANVLVDDKLRCVISDFGQSEMKSEAFRISGTPLPREWQAPELLLGQSRLMAEMDVYSFAICCIEILSMGRMPWPLQDDEAVRHLVLGAPHHHDSRFTNPAVQELLRTCWDRDPKLRPPFAKIVRDIKQLRRNAGHVDLESPQTQGLPPLEEVEPHLPSPDMRPAELPPSQSLCFFFSF